MPSLFPTLLSFQEVAPFIIRIVLGITLAHFGLRKIRQHGQSSGSNSKMYGAVEVLIAFFLIIGLYTQLAAMLNAAILVIKVGFKIKEGKFLNDGINYYVLLLAMAISVIFTGAGLFGLDTHL